MGVIYKLTDEEDNIVKYVGLVWTNNETLSDRIKKHKNDEWYNEHKWKIEYFPKEITTRVDADLTHAYYIKKYNTDKYYNKLRPYELKEDNLPEVKWEYFGLSYKNEVSDMKTEYDTLTIDYIADEDSYLLIMTDSEDKEKKQECKIAGDIFIYFQDAPLYLNDVFTFIKILCHRFNYKKTKNDQRLKFNDIDLEVYLSEIDGSLKEIWFDDIAIKFEKDKNGNIIMSLIYDHVKRYASIDDFCYMYKKTDDVDLPETTGELFKLIVESNK